MGGGVQRDRKVALDNLRRGICFVKIKAVLFTQSIAIRMCSTLFNVSQLKKNAVRMTIFSFVMGK